MDGAGDSLLLTSSGVSGLLDIHSSTVKRWCDERALASEKTDGGHRRIRLSNALDVACSRGIGTFLDPFHPWEANVWLAVAEAEAGDFGRLHNLALGWLGRGETDLLGRLLYELGNRPGIPFTAFLDVAVRGFVVRVGRAWQERRLVVGEEHMATQVVMEVLIRLRRDWDHLGLSGPSRDNLPGVAVVGAMEGDRHEVGVQAVRILLEREGSRVYYLGANVPLEDLAEIRRAQGASMVCISSSSRNALPDLQRAVRVLAQFYRPGSPYALALGGSLGSLRQSDIPEGPFQARSISRSAQEFLDWIRAFTNNGSTVDSRISGIGGSPAV